jgi:hypothetical protein
MCVLNVICYNLYSIAPSDLYSASIYSVYPSKIDIDTSQADTTINHTSNHLTEHKMAAYRYMINRILTLPFTAERKNKEWQKNPHYRR